MYENYANCDRERLQENIDSVGTFNEVNKPTGKYDPVQSPTDLVFEDDLLKWKEVTSASGYLVEWRPRQEGVYSGGQAEVRTTSWHAGSLSPGRWVVSVRATTDTSASKPESAEYLRNGE